MDNQKTQSRHFITVAAGVLALSVSSLATARVATSSNKPDPPNPIDLLPFEPQFDPTLYHDPTDKDESQPPVAYVDIPEIDRAPDNGGGGGASPLGSVAPTLPDDILAPVVISGIPALLPVPDTETFAVFQFGSGATDVVGADIFVSVSAEAPAPGTALVGALAAGALLRRRR